MSGNNTLAVLRARVRFMLNDANKKMWSDNHINTLLKEHYDFYYRLFMQNTKDELNNEITVTYPASATYYDLSGASAPVIGSIDLVEDVTDASDPVTLIRASTTEVAKSISHKHPNGGTPTHWFFQRQDTYSSGVATVVQFIALVPYPTSTRTLKIQCQHDEQGSMTADTHTTALPSSAERCMCLKTAMDCRIREENASEVNRMQALLEKAEREFLKDARTPITKQDEVVFDSNWID